MDLQITYVNNPNTQGDTFVNKYPQLIVAVKDLDAYELECKKQQYYIGIDHIKKLFNEYIHDVNHLTEKWDRKNIMGKDLKSWMDKQISYVNNPNKNGDRFVNQHTQMIVAMKDLDAYELECKKQQYYIGIDHIKKLFNEYIHDVNHLTEKWDRKNIMGKDLKSWMDKQISYVNNPNKNGNRFVNQHTQMIVAMKDLDAYALECKKLSKIEKRTQEKKKTDVYHLNNADLDTDDDIDQESVMTFNVNDDIDQESVKSSRKRKRNVGN